MAKGAARDLTKETFWRRMRDRQAGSPLSIRAWCREHGVNEGTFHWWRRELARRDAEEKRSVRLVAKQRSLSFVPIHVTEDGSKAPDPRIEIVLTDGRRVRVHDSVNRQTLADVLAVLEGGGC